MADFGLEPEGKGEEKTKPTVDVGLISRIQPRTPIRPIRRDMTESDRMAEMTGFTSREPSTPIVQPYIQPTRTKRKREQTYPFSMRPPVSVLQRFIAYAEKHRLSYPRALEKLLDDNDARENLSDQ